MQRTATRKLTSQHRKAIALLVSGLDQQTAAKQLGVHRATLHRWQKKDAFRAALQEAEAAVMGEVSRQLVSTAQSAVDMTKRLMFGQMPVVGPDGLITLVDVPPSVRLGAARTLLEQCIRLREFSLLEGEMAELRAVVATLSGGPDGEE